MQDLETGESDVMTEVDMAITVIEITTDLKVAGRKTFNIFRDSYLNKIWKKQNL